MGKSRTALELLRLSTQLKTKTKLQKKYSKTLDKFDKSYDVSLPHISSNKVWVCWLQGIENAPELVQKCYYSLKQNLVDREIILITADNIEQYVRFPDYIVSKWKAGIISNTHLTDLLRLELLIAYGGLWLDATVLCTSKEEDIPTYFFDSDLFFFQALKPGRDGKSTYLSSWLICSKTNNKILMATRELCYQYWLKNNRLIDYFLLHDFMSIALEKYSEDWNRIVPRDNSTPHILLLRLFSKYDEIVWESIISQTPFHKLSYKFETSEFNKPGTYYKMLLN